MPNIRIGIIGTGYVGLVTGACFAEVGHQVVCVDSHKEKVAALQAGKVPIFEPGLDDMVAENVAAGRLRFSTSIAEAVQASQVLFIAVGTPPKEDGSVDLSQVEGVSRAIAAAMGEYRVVVDKSTVPVRTGERVAETIHRYNKARVEFDVVSNPEFLREGSAIDDLMQPDRIVIGVSSERPVTIMREIYEPFLTETHAIYDDLEVSTGKVPFIVTDVNSAELIKHASNSFLATKISYANLMSQVCEASGANVEDVVRGMGLDARIGPKFLQAGIGYGGSCFPKDLSAFIHIGEELGCDFSLLRAVHDVNQTQMERFLQKVRDALWVLKGKRVAVLGLAFKPNTDDVRLSPSLKVVAGLKEEGADVAVYDPKAMDSVMRELARTGVGCAGIDYCTTLSDAYTGADAAVICTDWDEFRTMDLEKVRGAMRQPVVIDGRNMFDPKRMKELGFIYKSVGRPS